MKQTGYFIFACFFAIGRLFPVNKNKVVLYNGHDRALNGNLLGIRRAIKKKHPDTQFVYVAKNQLFSGSTLHRLLGMFCFFVVFPLHMATAHQIFLNDNFLPLGYCKLSRETKVIQLWHGIGAFKRFGLSTEKDQRVRRSVLLANKKITHLFVSTKQVIPYYAEAFGVPESRIYATGLPVTDFYRKKSTAARGRERFFFRYPQAKGKKILLYTPTFRRSEKENEQILRRFPARQIAESLGGDCILLIRLHPKFPGKNIGKNPCFLDVTDYPDVTDLYFASDLLITDYSSTVVEYVLLDRPMVFYAYDIDRYDRGFYRPYRQTAPGRIVTTEGELIRALQTALNGEDDTAKKRREDFLRMQYDAVDGKAAERILAVLEKEGKEKL